jgi:hypothetical protein
VRTEGEQGRYLLGHDAMTAGMLNSAALKQELATLDARRLDLDARLRDAVARQRYAPSEELAERARSDEAALLAEMDRLMTRIRAVEAKLLLAASGKRPSWA